MFTDAPSIPYPEMILDEIFLVREPYQRLPDEISVEYIVEQTGETRETILLRLKDCERLVQNCFIASQEGFLLDVTVTAPVVAGALWLHCRPLEEILEILSNNFPVVCVGGSPRQRLSACLALRKKGFTQVVCHQDSISDPV